MTTAKKLLSTQTGGDKLYVDDVFSTYLYTGNGSTQTINNGIDLAGEGGLVWTKIRNYDGSIPTPYHYLSDSVRGAEQLLSTNDTSPQRFLTEGTFIHRSNGFIVKDVPGWGTNSSGYSYASWTFRKAPKFFDIVTYTGNGVAGRQIPHGLGIAPGMVVVKCTNSSGLDWAVYHRSTGSTQRLLLNTADSAAVAAVWTVDPDSTTFTVGNFNLVNGNGNAYVAYLFAHDPSANGLIQCGSFTTDASGNAAVNLGWEPQFILTKRTDSSTSGDWRIADTMCGFTEPGTAGDFVLFPNTSGAEVSGNLGGPTATGFTYFGTASATYIYLAIRRPNKPPKTGAEVLTVGQGTGTSLTGRYGDDLTVWKQRNGTVASLSWGFVDRLRGISPWTSWMTNSNTSSPTLYSSSTAAEVVSGSKAGQFPGTSGVGGGNPNIITVMMNDGTNTPQGVAYFFRRAPGFFDVVCYTGTGVARTVPHGLGVAPELMIVKSRNAVSNWWVYVAPIGATNVLSLDQTSAAAASVYYWNNTPPTTAVFTVGNTWHVNESNGKFVAYLFASLPGVSKVGSYTGNGTSLSVECGFSTGARFILVKSVDNVGDWFVWDTARGIIAANDPHLSLNTPAAEVTTDDSVDPYAGGFIVNQNTATNINITGKRYIFLAIA